MKRRSIAAAALALLALTGCAADSYGPKETAGAVGGAVVGGLAGSRFGGGTGQLVATGIGTLIGAVLGSEAGRSLDRADRLYHREAAEQAHWNRIGERSAWQNPESGHSGWVSPIRQGYDRDGRYCREYQQTVVVGGRMETAYGTACLDADGSWRIVDGPPPWR
ncbi:RT0821/Lpp0805 family surface protein [Azospirillum sp. ST 5-10]|uniref:RT0821/Lpp0805 family surface protein n=1 Tax=unclassified Azospirillum TaxID=2630922 RepID=UPI003F49D669